MTDAQIADALMQARIVEREVRAGIQTEDLAERDASLVALRHVTALRRSLESWIADRTVRRSLTVPAAVSRRS